jgi:predicted ribosomally synthesized peptide with nif11-like leader
MSLQSANEFAVAVAKNPALAEESKTAAGDKSPADAALAICELGKREGYDFTPAEVLELHQNYARQLSESELDSVAGGTTDPTFVPIFLFPDSIFGDLFIAGCSSFAGGVRVAAGDTTGSGSTPIFVQAPDDSVDGNFNGGVRQISSGS